MLLLCSRMSSLSCETMAPYFIYHYYSCSCAFMMNYTLLLLLLLLLPILCRAASSAALSHIGGFRVGGGVHDSYQRLLVSHPKDTGKGGLTKLPKFRTQSRPQWESNPAGKNVRSPFIQSQRSTHSATLPT